MADRTDLRDPAFRLEHDAGLLEAFDHLVRPLLAAGWALRERHIETQFGADVSAIGGLERRAQLSNVERFPDGTSQVFPGGGASNDDSTPPLFQAEDDAHAIAEFGIRGWL